MAKKATTRTNKTRNTDKGTELPDGSVRLTFNGVTKDYDLLELQLLTMECEEVHSLRIDGNTVSPTREYLRELAKRLNDLGMEGCTPTAAWQLWVKVNDKVSELKKNLGT